MSSLEEIDTLSPDARSAYAQTLFEEREGMLSGVEVVPRNCIEDFFVNPAAVDSLPPGLRYMASSEYFFSHCAVTVPLERSTHTVLTRLSGGREMPLEQKIIPYNHMVGGIVTGKGSWMTGQILHAAQSWDEPLLSEHLGLLSVDGARFDTDFSNVLHSKNFRSSLHLGYLIFKEQPFKQWLHRRWHGSPVVQTIDQVFNLVMKNNGPAYLFRVGGTLERMGELGMVSSHDVVRKDFARSGLLLHRELMEGSSPFARMQDVLRSDGIDALSLTSHIARGELLSSQQYMHYAHMMSALYGVNARAINPIVSTFPHGMCNIAVFGQSKDTDLIFVASDFDDLVTDRAIDQTYAKDIFETAVASQLGVFLTDKIFPICVYPDKGDIRPHVDAELIREVMQKYES